MKTSKFQVGDKAYKHKGYKFPCTVVSIFENTSGETRIVAEMEDNGMLHIFNENQLEHCIPSNNLDKQYLNLVSDILKNGSSKTTRNGEVLSVFGRSFRHKMSEGFPLLTTKKMAWNQIVTELLWFLQGDTNIKYLVDNRCHIWDGDAYKKYVDNFTGIEDIPSKEWFISEIKSNLKFAEKWGNLGPIYGKQWREWSKNDCSYPGCICEDGEITYSQNKHQSIDQIQNLINDLKTNPDSRRLIVSAWNVAELEGMALPPCHYSFQFWTRELSNSERLKILNLKDREEFGHRILWESADTEKNVEKMDSTIVPTRGLSLMFNMRSNDVPLGLPFNIASYALLLEIIARMVNMEPDELVINLGDAHIYKNQIEGIEEQLKRDSYPLPTLKISKSVNFKGSIDDMIESCKQSDFFLENYQSHPSIKMPLSN